MIITARRRSARKLKLEFQRQAAASGSAAARPTARDNQGPGPFNMIRVQEPSLNF